jgi:hypothetical protein
MQKDYLKRTSENNPDTAQKVAKHPHHLHTYLPTRSATTGSIKDNSGAEVTNDRVILYIHGMLTDIQYDAELIDDRRSILLFVSRHTPISNPATCPESRSKGFRPCLSSITTVPFRESLLHPQIPKLTSSHVVYLTHWHLIFT